MTRRPFVTVVLLAGAALAAQSALDAQTPAPAPSSPATTAPAPQPTAPAPDPARRVNADAIDALIAKGEVVVLDVRDAKELEELGTLKGVIHIPIAQLESRLGELPKDKVILTACNSGGRASRAMTLLESKGFKTAGYCGLRDYKGPKVHPKAPEAKS
jgi:rhodanese-related sulfurtransferase